MSDLYSKEDFRRVSLRDYNYFLLLAMKKGCSVVKRGIFHSRMGEVCVAICSAWSRDHVEKPFHGFGSPVSRTHDTTLEMREHHGLDLASEHAAACRERNE